MIKSYRLIVSKCNNSRNASLSSSSTCTRSIPSAAAFGFSHPFTHTTRCYGTSKSKIAPNRNPPSLSHPKIRQKRNNEHLNRLIRAMDRYISQNKFDEAHEVWQRISELEYLALNENVVNTYMKALVHQGKYDQVQQVWQKYFAEGELLPTKRSFNILMHGYAEEGRVADVEQLLRKMQGDWDLEPNEISYTNLVKAVWKEQGSDAAWERYKDIFIASPSELTQVQQMQQGDSARKQRGESSLQRRDSSTDQSEQSTTPTSILPKQGKLIPMATTTKILLNIRGDEALPLVRMWTRNKEIPQVLVEYYCEGNRLDEALAVFGEFFECPYFGNKVNNQNIKKQFPQIGVYNSLVDCSLRRYEEEQADEEIPDQQLDEYLEVGYNLYNSFMENGTARMTEELANKFLFIFVELGKTEEAFLQIYRRFFVPEKAISRRTLIKINIPTFSQTRGQLLKPTEETFALLIRGAENDGLVQVGETLRSEMVHFLREMNKQKKQDSEEV